jgi:flagellar basal body rod protein FlgG
MPRVRFSIQALLSLIALIAASLAAWANVPEESPLRRTHRELDVAIMGDGYFVVVNPDTGEMGYTRRGELALDVNKVVVLKGTNFPIEPTINMPFDATELKISAEGRVSVYYTANSPISDIGQLQIARFANNGGLRPVGDSVYEATDASNAPIVSNPGQQGTGVLQQGWLEAPYSAKELAVFYAPLALICISFFSLLLALVRGRESSANGIYRSGESCRAMTHPAH